MMSAITVDQEKHQDLTVVRLTGRLDSETLGHLESALPPVVAESESGVALELSGVTYLNSAALRLMLTTHRDLTAADKNLYVVGAQGFVNEVLDVTGMKGFLSLKANLEEIGA
jgi:anti-sigma B factor antagonist